MASDPVCKMEVDERKAPATSEYKGKRYYFCSVGCKKAFDQNPEKYLSYKPEGQSSTGCARGYLHRRSEDGMGVDYRTPSTLVKNIKEE